MKYPSFKQWEKELTDCQTKLKDSIILVTKSVTIANCSYVFTIGKGTLRIAEEDGGSVWVREIRPIYNHHKAEFNDFLNNEIKPATEKVYSATNEILNVITSDKIPEVLLKRMLGEDVETDGATMVRELTTENLKKLVSAMGKLPENLRNIEVELKTGEALQLSWGGRHGYIMWGDIAIRSNDFATVLNIEHCLKFNSNFELIKKRLIEFCNAVRKLPK